MDRETKHQAYQLFLERDQFVNPKGAMLVRLPSFPHKSNVDLQDEKLVDAEGHNRQFLRFEDITRQDYPLDDPKTRQHNIPSQPPAWNTKPT